MKIYLAPNAPASDLEKVIELVRVDELGTCPTCSQEDLARGNRLAYEEGQKFAMWIREHVTGRFYDGLKQGLG